MIVAWRLSKAKYAKFAFDGEGARLEGGRWNRKGVPVVYLADHPALAALETFVHIPKSASKISFVLFRVEIPKDLRIADVPELRLPTGWRAEPPGPDTMAIGNEWIVRNEEGVLRVPSVLIPMTANYVLNPLHPDFRRSKSEHRSRSVSTRGCGNDNKKTTVSWRWKRGTHRFPGITDAKTFSLNIHRVVVENGIEKKIEGCVLRVVGDAATYEKAVQVADAVVAELNAGRKTAECFPKSIDARRVEPEEIPSFREEEFIVDRSGLRRRNNRGFAHGRAKLTLEKILYIKDHYVPD